ncbi:MULTISPECIES: enoyl-CoA hydratase/isomerase family protein [Sphingobium]|uniref:Enoyl-CoA hydratase n=2 Tax=Sphingobium fuliginis (strain ATCC 27551) TaxID=336203 RepID=A0A292ZM24_SPHSA|nr:MULTISPECIES: enoyl-CoA hydratase/isomerase family protein [Sphingobium]PNQ04249.1 enoyl-CoA hydratase [Sphingobium sp. SA916]QDC39804.1 enoyl-CoA hydratase/isomerase family protein [Sphingobium fuliginis ATCC 27551]GAY24497.1 enoyl-CoA hydratase [Sphingobium fuliginis]
MGEAFDNIIMTQDDGIVELRIHHRGGPAKWALWGGLHRELGIAFAQVAADPDARVLLITGTGDSFCAEFDMDCDMPQMGAATWDVIFREGRALLNNLLAIEIPVLAAVNGPAFIHAEIALLADVVLAAEGAVFADRPHALAGVVPGDGVHSIWPMLLGPNRGRYFLMTGQEIGAAEALSLGLVGEVLSPEALMPRAWELARTIAARPAIANRYTRMLLTREIKGRLAAELDQGLAMEGMAILAGMQGQAR